MIKELSKLTMSMFIDLLCGETEVLEPDGASAEEIETVKESLMFKFVQISDPASASRLVSGRATRLKLQMEKTLFTICSNLVEIRCFDEAKSLLAEYGYRREYTEDALKAEVTALRKRAESEITRLESEEVTQNAQTPEEIRSSYDRQCAFLMTYFRFQIDLNTIRASQFACMISQSTREIKAKQAAMSQKSRL